MKDYIVTVCDDQMMIVGDIRWNPELIRCRDCVYFTSEKSGEHWNTCRFYDAPKTEDGYCNDAERRGEKE